MSERVRLVGFVCMMHLSIMSLTAQEIVCPVIADNSIASYPGERKENTGASNTVKIKGRENQIIMKFDLSKIPENSPIKKAVLSVKLSGPEYALRQVGYSTVPTDWVEGENAAPNAPNREYSCHSWPGGKGNYWAEKGMSILNIIYGNGGNVSGWTLAEQQGDRFNMIIPGRAIEAMLKDQKGGLLLTDETGWWHGKVSNIYVQSRESKNPPVLTVTLGNKDSVAPGDPSIRQIPDDLGDGEVILEISCSGGDGEKGMALGFDIKVSEGEKISSSNWNSVNSLPRYLVKRPKISGSKLRIWLQDLKPGALYDFGIQAYDAAGNRSKIVTSGLIKAKSTAKEPSFKLETIKVVKGGPLKAKGLKIWAVDELIKINPLNGAVLDGTEYVDKGFREGNTAWNGKKKAVVLFGAKAEVVSFRLALELNGVDSLKNISVTSTGLKKGRSVIAAKNVSFRRDWYAKSKTGWYVCAMPNLKGKDDGIFSIPVSDQDIKGQTLQSVYVSVLIPKETSAGNYKGAITISVDGKEIKLPVRLKVYDVTIPDELSYLIELNNYGFRGKDETTRKWFHGVHRLAHEFRLGYNTVPYSHSGNDTVPFTPEIEGEGTSAKVKSWKTWDSWMGPLLDGSAFEGLPREGTPIPHYYLPFYESYPVEIYNEYAEGKFHNNKHIKAGEKWSTEVWKNFMCRNDLFVEDAFSQKWKDGAVSVASEFRKHFEAKEWTKTSFQIFANNKLYGRNSLEKTTTSLWTLDEPSFGRDFRALQFLYKSFQRPFEGSNLKVVSRGDVSRPEWQGNRLDGTCDVIVVGGSIYGFQRLIQKRIHEYGNAYWFYGGGRGISADSNQMVGLYLKSWTLGCVGGLAYWTSEHGNDWDKDDTLAVVLSSAHGYTGATPSDRIIAQRRSQQNIELLNLLAKKKGWSRRCVIRSIRANIDLASKTVRKNADDPGLTTMKNADSKTLLELRKTVLEQLD
ncbi:MAG: hypothetical protein KAI74_03210 [Kiritimatiellae bacterium]|nr:hypothetical protein [Kiritimatiellia bacterium]